MVLSVRNVKWIIFLALVSSNFAYTPDSFAATSFRCGKELVSLGDERVEVLIKCGEPMSKVWEYSFVESWTYNPGKTGFMKRLIFSNGIITSIETLGRGR